MDKLDKIIDQMDPTYHNVRSIHEMVYHMQDEQKRINSRLARIENMLEQLIRNQR